MYIYVCEEGLRLIFDCVLVCVFRLNAAVSIAGHVTGVLKGLIIIAVYVSETLVLSWTH